MSSNLGTLDRVIRVVLGVVAAVASYLVGPATAGGAVAAVVAVILLATAIVGFCPLYAVIGLRTNAARHR